MFIAVRVDTNTAETFRHGVWYAKGDARQRLDIVPLTLAQFQRNFTAMFEAGKADPEQPRSKRPGGQNRRGVYRARAVLRRFFRKISK